MIIRLLAKLSEVEIQPHGKMVYDPEVATKKGFQFLGILSPDLQRLGTLLDQQRALRNTERQAFENRMKEVQESSSLSKHEKAEILSKEIPDRLTVLNGLEDAIQVLEEIFNLELSYELKLESEKDTRGLILIIFTNWEVAVKPIGGNDNLREPSQDPPKERSTRRAHIHGKRGEA